MEESASAVAKRASTGAAAGSLSGGPGAKAASPTTELFRFVSASELDDIANYGSREGPNSMSGKWFADSAENASKWGDVMYRGNGQVIRVTVSQDFASSLYRANNLDGIGGARYVSNDLLSTLNDFGWSVSK